MFQTGVIHLFVSYTLMLHILVRFVLTSKDVELPWQSKPRHREQNLYKKQVGQR